MGMESGPTVISFSPDKSQRNAYPVRTGLWKPCEPSAESGPIALTI